MSIEIMLTFAVIGAVWTGALAAGKNRSAVGWAVFGFLFPAIAVLAIWCARPLAPGAPGALPSGGCPPPTRSPG